VIVCGFFANPMGGVLDWIGLFGLAGAGS